MQDFWISFINMFRAFHSYEYTQFLFKSVYFMHFLPHFWVKIRSKKGKMHRLYHKTCASLLYFSNNILFLEHVKNSRIKKHSSSIFFNYELMEALTLPLFCVHIWEVGLRIIFHNFLFSWLIEIRSKRRKSLYS